MPATAGATTTASSRARSRGARARGSGLPGEVLKSIEDGQHAAADAVRRFVDTVDRALPLRGDNAHSRQEVVDSALEMADRLVQTQFDLLRKAVRSAGRPFGNSTKGR